MRAPVSVVSLSLIAAVCACTARMDAKGQRAPASSDARLADSSPVVREPATDPLKGWTAETFALPPEFAPGLPTGRESLRFAPGWSDPRAEDFWSYAFVMWIDESAPSAARIKDLLQSYYDGLVSSLAAGKNKDTRPSPARLDVVRSATNFFELKMRLVDAFATFESIDLRVVVDSIADTEARTVLQIQVSPQPKEHAIWQSLQEAIVSIVSRDAALRRPLGRTGGGETSRKPDAAPAVCVPK